jgi:hypothetical protein
MAVLTQREQLAREQHASLLEFTVPRSLCEAQSANSRLDDCFGLGGRDIAHGSRQPPRRTFEGRRLGARGDLIKCFGRTFDWRQSLVVRASGIDIRVGSRGGHFVARSASGCGSRFLEDRDEPLRGAARGRSGARARPSGTGGEVVGRPRAYIASGIGGGRHSHAAMNSLCDAAE